MAAKKVNQGEAKKWTKAKWKGFVNVYLNKQEKEQIKKELFDESGLFLFLQGAAEDGYKVSLSYSPGESVYTVSLTGQYQEMPNAGLTMSLRHREVDVAVTALWWCHNEAGKNGSWEERYTTASKDDW